MNARRHVKKYTPQRQSISMFNDRDEEVLQYKQTHKDKIIKKAIKFQHENVLNQTKHHKSV